MLKTETKPKELQRRFRVRKAAVSMGIAGTRRSLHFKILEHLEEKQREAAA